MKPDRQWNIGALAEAVKDKLELEARLNLIFVYPPKTCASKSHYKSGKPLKEVIDELKNKTPPTSDDHPLIVVAPSPPNGEKMF